MNDKTTELRFENSPNDTFCIYQLHHNAPVELRFASLDQLIMLPMHENYSAVYTDTLPSRGTTVETLEYLYKIFNIDHPADFKGHSLSVSDIVALKQNDIISYHYCDRIGFKELTNFNHMKTSKELDKPSVRTKIEKLKNELNDRTPSKTSKEPLKNISERSRDDVR
jgi:DNA repair protein RadC